MLSRRALLAALAGQPRQWLLGSNTAVQGYGLFAAIELVQQLEFPVIEIHPMGRPEPTPGAFPGFRFGELPPAERRRLRAALKPFRRITTHLPYTGLNWLSRDAVERRKAVETVDIALEGSAYCGARLAVLHPQTLTNEPWQPHQTEYVEVIRRWADRAQKLGIQIAIETGFPPSVAGFTGLVKAIDHKNVGVTIDVGHQGRYAELVARVAAEDRAKPASVAAYNETTLSIIDQLGPKVLHLHVHDIDPVTWVEHKPLVHGFVDYPRLFRKLREIAYAGVLVFEIGGDPALMPGHLRQARDQFRQWMTA